MEKYQMPYTIKALNTLVLKANATLNHFEKEDGGPATGDSVPADLTVSFLCFYACKSEQNQFKPKWNRFKVRGSA